MHFFYSCVAARGLTELSSPSGDARGEPRSEPLRPALEMDGDLFLGDAESSVPLDGLAGFASPALLSDTAARGFAPISFVLLRANVLLFFNPFFFSTSVAPSVEE